MTEGGDANEQDDIISIHTPTQGVTKDATTIPDEVKISIHTPTQGVTKKSPRGTGEDIIFQSTLPRRE